MPAGVVDCSTGNPDPELLPDLRPALARLEPPPALYGVAPCSPELAAAAGARLAAEQVPYERVTATFGALDAIERVLLAELRPGDRVAVEDPGWAAELDLVTSGGWRPVAVAVDDEGPLPAALVRALDRGVRAVLCTSRAQNPTGSAISVGHAAELRAVLADHPDVVVVEDDHGDGIVTERCSPIVGTTGRWAFVRSVAKAYSPDLRLATLAGDETTVARVEGRLALGPGWVSHLLQRLVVDLWGDREVTAAIAVAAATYDARRRSLVDELERRGVAARGRSGLNCWVPVADEDATVAALLEAGWLVAKGSRFRVGAPPAVRVTTAALPADRAGELAEAIAATVRPPASTASGGARRIT